MASRTNSSIRGLALPERFRYWASLFAMRLRGLRRKVDLDGERANIQEYRDALLTHCDKRLEDCRVLEIGFGQRPWRLYLLANMGVDIIGVDLDRPVTRGSPREFLEILRENGAERMLKSAVRFFLFDIRERRAIEAATGRPLVIPTDRLIVGDASSDEFWRRLDPLDFIYSEDVFEHIPVDGLARMVSAMAKRLKPNGLAFIRPTVFTGITGGHTPEWFGHTLAEERQRRSQPWEHLRGNRFTADTFLNRLRPADYRQLFKQHFEIVKEVVIHPGLGREFLTPEVRAELSDYSEDELLSNKILFLLRPKKSGDLSKA